MLENEFKYYLDHQDDLVAKYNNKFIVIVGNEVIGAFDTNLEAYNEAKKNHQPGTFLIQKCFAGKEGYTSTFYSRVFFN